MNPSFSAFTDAQRQSIQIQILTSGQAIQGVNPGYIVLKLYMPSLEYDQITSFPQNGLQYIEKISREMGFFLGMSIFSFVEFILLLLLFLWIMIIMSNTTKPATAVHSIQNVQRSLDN